MTERLTSGTGGRPRWLPPMALLLLSVLVAVLGRFVPVVSTADGSSAAPAVGTGWLVVLPLVAALLMTTLCTDGTVGVIAGAGAVAAGRLLADLGLFLAPDAVLRPELLGVGSVSAFPLSATWGAVVPVLADLLAVLAAATAARLVLDGYEVPDRGDPAGVAWVTGRGRSGRPRRRPPAWWRWWWSSRRRSVCCTRRRYPWCGPWEWPTSGCSAPPAPSRADCCCVSWSWSPPRCHPGRRAGSSSGRARRRRSPR